MKKSIVAGLAVLGIAGVLHAEEVSIGEKIIGLEVGASKIEADSIFLGDNYEGNDIEYGLRLGAQNKQWRTLIVLNYYDANDDDQEYIKGMATFDYLLIQDSPLKPYLGVNVGYIDYTSQERDDSGFLYGGQVGVLYRVAENIQVDVTYRYSFVESDYVNHVEGIVVGLNYIF